MRLDYEMLDYKAIWKLKSQFMFFVSVFHINVDLFLHPSPIWGIFVRHVPVQLLSNDLIKCCSVQVCDICVS